MDGSLTAEQITELKEAFTLFDKVCNIYFKRSLFSVIRTNLSRLWDSCISIHFTITKFKSLCFMFVSHLRFKAVYDLPFAILLSFINYPFVVYVFYQFRPFLCMFKKFDEILNSKFSSFKNEIKNALELGLDFFKYRLYIN